jgi:hypothetical protein
MSERQVAARGIPPTTCSADNDLVVPELSLSVIRAGIPGNVAEVGPISSYDFDPLLAQLLAEGDWAQPAGRTAPTMVNCHGVFDETSPSFSVSRFVLGQLVEFGMSVRLVLTRLPVLSGLPVGSGLDVDPSLDPPETEVIFHLETHESRSPEELSHALGLPPTSAIRAGERATPKSRVSPTTRWNFSIGRRPSRNFDDQFRAMIAILRPRAKTIASLTTERWDGVLSFVAYFVDAVPQLELTNQDLRLLRELGLEIDVDLYPIARERQDPLRSAPP